MLLICDRIWENQPVGEKINLSVRDAKVIQAEIAEFFFLLGSIETTLLHRYM